MKCYTHFHLFIIFQTTKWKGQADSLRKVCIEIRLDWPRTVSGHIHMHLMCKSHCTYNCSTCLHTMCWNMNIEYYRRAGKKYHMYHWPLKVCVIQSASVTYPKFWGLHVRGPMIHMRFFSCLLSILSELVHFIEYIFPKGCIAVNLHMSTKPNAVIVSHLKSQHVFTGGVLKTLCLIMKKWFLYD